MGLAACGGGSLDDSLKIQSITPGFVSMQGGSHITITGQGFSRDGAAPNHVVIGTNEAVAASPTDDLTLEVVAPPADMAGDVSVTVFNRNGTVTAMGMLHYSTAPKIDSSSPAEVLYNATDVTITVTGSGFKDEGAGAPIVTVNGEPAIDVAVASDTQITFTTRPQQPFAAVDIDVTNARGTAHKANAYRTIPSTHAGFIAFARSTSVYAVFYDPMANTTLTIPTTRQRADHVRGSYYDSEGRLNVLVSGPVQQGGGSRANMQIGVLDFNTQTVVNPVAVDPSTAPATLVSFNGKLYTYDRNSGQFATLDPTTGALHQIGASGNYCCQSLAVNGTTMYMVNGLGVSTIDPASGVRGTVFTLNPAHNTTEVRFMGNTLYGLDQQGVLFTIDPTTGATAAVHTFPVQTSGLEVFTP